MNNLRFLRESQGLSLGELANLVGINKSYLSRVENDISPISMGVAIVIADSLNCSLDELMGRVSLKIRKD